MHEYKALDYLKPDENINIMKYTTACDEPVHTHDFIELEYIFKGSGYQDINGERYFVERGDLLFLNFRDRHAIYPSQELGIVNCLFSPQFFGSELVSSENALDILNLAAFNEFKDTTVKLLPKVKFTGRDLVEVETVLEFIRSEFINKEKGYMTCLKGYINVLLARVFRLLRNDGAPDFNVYMDKIAPRVLQYIEDNYRRKLTLKELAAESFYNPSYFSRVFRECSGKTLTDYINEKRISAAMDLLLQTEDPVESVGHRVGVNDKKQFYKLFKAQTGMTPDMYRRQSAGQSSRD